MATRREELEKVSYNGVTVKEMEQAHKTYMKFLQGFMVKTTVDDNDCTVSAFLALNDLMLNNVQFAMQKRFKDIQEYLKKQIQKENSEEGKPEEKPQTIKGICS